jgi:hypothetical protein
MKEKTLPPKAAALSEAMRDIGYSLEAAIADIIDNSISAGASHVDISFDIQSSKTRLAIIDDGHGMSEDALIEAMRHGSSNPRSHRSKGDLGRFGLGLKTASFSQCKKLIVISREEGSYAGAVWDLTLVSDRDEWIVGVLEEEEISETPLVERIGKCGTLVLWENLDRLCESETGVVNEKLIYGKILEVEKHLSLVFHRFLSGDIKGKKLSIAINNHELEPFDPFCTTNKATQFLNKEIIRIDGEEIQIQPFILPHHSKLTQRERDYYNSRSDFLNNQGAYVYRNGRLMAWADWFRLVPKGESTKLARIRIDFPNSLDDYWTIDIKKSRAYPPHAVREQLKKIIGKITESSIRVHSGRGKKLYANIPVPIWVRIAKQGAIKYSLDREHPIISAIMKSAAESENKRIDEVLSLIEGSIPIESIYSDYSISPQELEKTEQIDQDDILNRLESVWAILSENQEPNDALFREIVCSLKPFCNYPDIVDKFIRSKFNG